MKKKVLLFFLSMLVINIHAQELSEKVLEAKEDSIFNLKLAGDSRYAETVVEMIMEDDAKVTEAKHQSMLLLQTHVVKIFSECLNMNAEHVREIWEIIEEKSDEIEIKKGDLYKVCKYIAKDAWAGWLGSKKVKPLTPEDSLILFGPKEKKVMAKKEINKEDNTLTASVKESKTPDVILPPANIKEPKQSTGVNTSTAVATTNVSAGSNSVNTVPTTNVTEVKKAVVPEVKKENMASTEVVIPKLCQKIIEKGDFQSLMVFLEQEELYNNLIYGNENKMQYLSKCYVVIISKESKNIVAVLDKGESGRMNFMTKQTDYYGNYGKNKYLTLFVQEL